MIHRDFWRGRRVLLTGHTGFKGAWLATWLLDLGCEVHGVGLAPQTTPSLFELSGLSHRLHHVVEDLRSPDTAARALERSAPDVVLHLAAQPILRRALRDPLETFETNVMGTVHLLEAVRHCPSVAAVVVVTSDKCYEEHTDGAAYREGDPLGGRDPYSASKGCQEIVAHAYRRSYLGGRLATARAGNVIGGGDWSEDRIVPDAVRALIGGRELTLRSPGSVRPWQHVLDPLAGYLRLAERLSAGSGADRSWNFGPAELDPPTVSDLVNRVHDAWGRGSWAPVTDPDAGSEAAVLRLDATLAREHLGWAPRIDFDRAVRLTVEWYRDVLERGADAFDLTRRQIREYEATGSA